MAYCFYNGVKLPELPNTNYPYCWIRKNDNTQYYDLILTKVVGYYDASVGGIVYGANAATAEIAHYRVAYANVSTANSWENYQTTNTWMALDANRTIMWSNHYIPNGSLSATQMYFDGYEAIPEVESYQIEKDTVVGIADQVRRLCKTEATMTPAQLESNLGDLNIDLMETFVISGPVEQVIYPDEGYYGFSKITVGAVDGGSGGIGGGGGGSGGSAEDTTFGDEFGEVEIPTGNLDYSSGTDKNPFYIPEIPGDGAYKVLFRGKSEAGTNFRVSISGPSGNRTYDIETSSPAFACAVTGRAYYDRDPLNVYTDRHVHLFVCTTSGLSAQYKLTTESSWRDPWRTLYGDGYRLYDLVWEIDTVWDVVSNENPYSVTGIPCYDVGLISFDESATDTSLNEAMCSAAASILTEERNPYMAIVSDSPILYDGSVVSNADGSPMSIYILAGDGKGGWDYRGETDGADFPTTGYAVLWNSHDLKDLTGQYVTHSKSDDPIPEMTGTGESAWQPVERNEIYSVEGSTLNGLVGAAQKITGSQTPMTPSQATTVLEEYYNQPKAEELTY